MKLLGMITLLFMIVSSCTEAEKSHETPVQGIVQDAANFTNKGTLSLIGTEPFWNVMIEGESLKYQSIDSTQNLSFSSFHTSLIDPLTYRYTASNGLGDKVEVTLHKATCSDGMSDIVYPYCADVKLERKDADSAELLQGCGDYAH